MSRTVALAGNPNVGKSTIFNALTGLRQHTGNWPGKTIIKAEGVFRFHDMEYTIVDLPGAYSLLNHCAEEEVAREYICSDSADLTIVICDATCLERNLNLVLQTLQITKKVIVCVNLLDEARKKRIWINLNLLSNILGVPVVGTSATTQEGLLNLKNAIFEYYERDSAKLQAQENITIPVQNNMSEAEYFASLVTRYFKPNYDKRDRRLDHILTNRITGIPIMILLLGIMLWITIWGANYPSSLLSQFFFWLEGHLFTLANFLHLPALLQDVLIHGIYRVLTWVISVMLPPMAIFFPLFTLLEDFGYLPRIAFNLDHQFKKACSCGKQALTMCMVVNW